MHGRPFWTAYLHLCLASCDATYYISRHPRFADDAVFCVVEAVDL